MMDKQGLFPPCCLPSIGGKVVGEAQKYFHARAMGLQKVYSSPRLLPALVTQDRLSQSLDGASRWRVTHLVNESVVSAVLSSAWKNPGEKRAPAALPAGEHLPIFQSEQLEFSLHSTGVATQKQGRLRCYHRRGMKKLFKVVKSVCKA